MSENRVIRPYSFDDDTINERNSHSLLKELFVPELKRSGKASSAIFQQDGVPRHFSRDIRQYLDKIFSTSVDGKGWSHEMGTKFPSLGSVGLFSLGMC